LPIQIAAEVWYCEGRDKIAANLSEVKPTLMTAVPRLYELLHDRITKSVTAKGGLSARLFWLAVKLGRKKLVGQTLSVTETVLDKCLDFLVRKKVKQRFGGRLAFFVSGGAALNPDIGSFFLSLGVNILQGYGQTEASPLISANRPGQIRIETVGPAVDGVEVKLSDDGELLARGACLMKGYWRNEAATAETIIDGWLHTGDLAHIDADGFVSITGRKKEIIVTSGGENIAPSRVEAELTVEAEIAQIMVFGDARPHLVALIVPSIEVRVETEAFQKQKISQAVQRANARLPVLERVRNYQILNEEFTIDNRMLTPTLKVRRHVVIEAYKDKLDALYRSRRKR
jgi:long-chain acyl-CoA synthetase